MALYSSFRLSLGVAIRCAVWLLYASSAFHIKVVLIVCRKRSNLKETVSFRLTGNDQIMIKCLSDYDQLHQTMST